MLIVGGRVVDPSQGIDALLDVRLGNGVVMEIGPNLVREPAEEILEAAGAYVAPGFIDMHVHLREPGNPEKETIATGSAAAVAGGFTAVAAMPNTQPPLDSPASVQSARNASERALCRVHIVAAITQGRAGAQLLDYVELERAGAVAFSDDGNTVMNARILRNAALAALPARGPFIAHCEDEQLKGDGVMHQGGVSDRLRVPGSPGIAEDVTVARDLLVASDTKKPWHIAHVTRGTCVEMLRAAQDRGVTVTCEVTPHHLLFTDALVADLASGAKVNPPLREERDTHALRQAVREGHIDAFASDHAPHTENEKSTELACGAVGFSGLEIAVGAYAYAVPDLSLARFVEMLSVNPARILRVAGGTLAVGSPADVTIFADVPWQVDSGRFYSKGRSTPFDGMRLPRRAVATIVRGRLVMHQGRIATGVHT